MILAVLACAFAQMPVGPWKVPSPIGALQLSSSGHFAVAYTKDDSQAYLVNLRTHACTPIASRFVRLSEDDKYGLCQTKNGGGPFDLVELETGKISQLPFDVESAAFAPEGHLIALKTHDAPAEIKIYDAATGEVRKLTGFYDEIRSPGEHRVEPYMHIDSWTAQGIVLNVNLNPMMNAGDTAFFVDPETGHAKRDRDPYYESPFGVLPDGSLVVWTTADSKASGVGISFDNKIQRMLLTKNDVGDEYVTFQPPFGKLRSNIVLITVIDRTSTKGQLWVANAVTGKRALVVKEEWAQHRFFSIPSAISPDGKWVIYRDSSDDSLLTMAPVPKSVSVVNLAQSQNAG